MFEIAKLLKAYDQLITLHSRTTIRKEISVIRYVTIVSIIKACGRPHFGHMVTMKRLLLYAYIPVHLLDDRKRVEV